MKILKTGDPCPFCGEPIRCTDPDTLRMLAVIADIAGAAGLRKEENNADDKR